jgi:hypothetical protein
MLNSYNRVFDIFKHTAVPDMTLIRGGFIPPLPVFKNNLVWGGAIVSAALEEGVSLLPICEISGEPLECAIIALCLEGRKDNYSFEEMDGIARYLSSNGIKEPPESISKLIADGDSFTAKIKKYGRLNRTLQNAVDTGLLDLKTAIRADSIPEPVIEKVLSGDLELTYSARRIFLTMLREVIMRDALKDTQVLILLEEAVQSGDPMGFLQGKRYPDLTALEVKYRQLRERLVKGRGLEIKAPAYFEGGSYRIEFSAAGAKQLERKIAVLKEILGEWNKFEELLF